MVPGISHHRLRLQTSATCHRIAVEPLFRKYRHNSYHKRQNSRLRKDTARYTVDTQTDPVYKQSYTCQSENKTYYHCCHSLELAVPVTMAAVKRFARKPDKHKDYYVGNKIRQ